MFATFTNVTRRSEMPLAQGTPGGTPAPTHVSVHEPSTHRAPFPSDNPEDAWLAPHVAPEGARELLKRALRFARALCTLTSESSLRLSRFRVEEM